MLKVLGNNITGPQLTLDKSFLFMNAERNQIKQDIGKFTWKWLF